MRGRSPHISTGPTSRVNFGNSISVKANSAPVPLLLWFKSRQDLLPGVHEAGRSRKHDCFKHITELNCALHYPAREHHNKGGI
jgi:hypothetical protein